jgi:hypothetical protein
MLEGPPRWYPATSTLPLCPPSLIDQARQALRVRRSQCPSRSRDSHHELDRSSKDLAVLYLAPSWTTSMAWCSGGPHDQRRACAQRQQCRPELHTHQRRAPGTRGAGRRDQTLVGNKVRMKWNFLTSRHPRSSRQPISFSTRNNNFVAVNATSLRPLLPPDGAWASPWPFFGAGTAFPTPTTAGFSSPAAPAGNIINAHCLGTAGGGGFFRPLSHSPTA